MYGFIFVRGRLAVVFIVVVIVGIIASSLTYSYRGDTIIGLFAGLTRVKVVETIGLSR